MNHGKIIDDLKKEFPGKAIIALPSEEPKEIICEIDPTELHPDYSIAIAYIDASEPHYHQKSVETYFVEEGVLKLYIEGEEHVLEVGQKLTIEPPAVHWAKGDATRVRVESKPGWTLDDHILVEKNDS